MNRRRMLLILCLALLLAALAAGGTAAQTSPSYNLEWHTIGAGGGSSSSASYAVGGMAGQILSGASPLSSASYVVRGGFVGGGGFETIYTIYLPLVTKG